MLMAVAKASSKRVAVKRKAALAKRKKAATAKTVQKPDIAASYNSVKDFGGRQYTGMQVGRSHKWYYDKGTWTETKITPDLWRVSYAVTKRRAGKAPKGSGVPVGTAYQWYILAHQRVEKLNDDDYSTSLIGLKYKLAHKRASKGKWSAGTVAQRRHLIMFLREWLRELEKETISLTLEYKGVVYKGEAVPVPETCANGMCQQMDITLNNEHLGIIRWLKSGWKLDQQKDQGFVKAIGAAIMAYYGK